MPTRRVFIESGIAVAAIATAPLAGAALPAPAVARRGKPAATFSLYRVVFDRTLAAGRAFGAAAARRGAPVHAIGSDLGRVWMQTLEPRLKAGPVALAGLTKAAPLFCLEYLARNYGLRTVYRIEHAPTEDRRVVHALTGQPELARCADELAAAGAHWAEAAAELATACPADLQPAAPIALLDLNEHPRRAAALFTWLLAPCDDGSLRTPHS